MTEVSILRAPAEQTYEAELAALADKDDGNRPRGWRLSPRSVRTFIVGDRKLKITRKFYGDDARFDLTSDGSDTVASIDIPVRPADRRTA